LASGSRVDTLKIRWALLASDLELGSGETDPLHRATSGFIADVVDQFGRRGEKFL